MWEICFEEVLWQTDNSMHIAVHPANNKDDDDGEDYDGEDNDDIASYTSFYA